MMSSKYHWELWYAWYPKRINGRWYFRETVYRRYQISPGKGYFVYADSFDLLKQ